MANGGIIGPVVTPPNVQTQSAPGVWTLQEAQEYIRQGLWPRRYDPLYNYTTLLLSGNGANNATNSSFLDSSSNNFTVTRNGNTTQGTFSPFSQTGWGNYFDGTGDYLSVADNSVLRLGTSNFTIECWVNRAANGTAHSILAKGGASTGWLLEVTSGNVLQFTHTTTTITTSLPVYAGNWVHVAAVREGTGSNQFKLYINGTLAQTATMATDFTQTDTLYIGANRSAATTMNGYISNVRIVNGTALYTAQFTPSTTPLTTTSQGATATQVELLTCQSNRFLDNSGNGFTVTPAGNSAVVAFSPFNATRPWDPLTYGGGGYFDGSGDYLNYTQTGGVGNGDFTLELWLYPIQIGDAIRNVWDCRSVEGGTDGFWLGSDTTNFYMYYASSKVISTSYPTVNAWTHVALVRSGNDHKLYFNGTQVGSTYTAANNYSNTSIFISRYFGLATYYTNGYFSSLRLVKGTAVYTAAFTPPTAPLTNITNTSLLLNFTNIGITDATSKNALETVGDAKISTAQSKFGGSSIVFDGTGDFLSVVSTSLLGYGTGNFTIEFWTYVTSTSNTPYFFDCRTTATANEAVPALYINGGNYEYYVSGAARITGGAVPTNQWVHVALVRNSGTTTLYSNGTSTGTYSDSTSYISCPMVIGQRKDTTSQSLNGYIQEFRVTKGVARYTENFAVPDSAFATLGNTPPSVDPYFDYTTLLLPGSGSNNATNSSFLDSSANNFTITRNGNTTQGTFSPFSQTGWSNYFDGTGDYLGGIGAASNWAFMSNATALWSLECWLFSSSSTAQQIIDTCGGASANVGLYVNKTSSNTITFGIARGVSASWVVTGTTTGTLTQNAWNHLLITYDQSLSTQNLKVYINGATAETFNKTANAPSGSNPTYSLLIAGVNAYAAEYWNGYISNLRISNVIRSSGVPTAPYTPDANTSLLTCQSNRFIDNSSNNFTITRNGDTRVVAFSPFNPSASWSAATYGGSGYFDGSGDYLTVPNNTPVQLGTGDFEIDAWVYVSSIAATVLIDARSSGTASSYTLGYNSSGFPYIYDGSTSYTGSSGITAGQWNYIVWTRSSGTLRIFVNGTSVYSASNSSSLTGAGTNLTICSIVSAGGQSLTGYLSDLRIVKGAGITTSTVPTSPLTTTVSSGTVGLLLNFTNAGIYDATSKNDLETVGDAKISTAQSVWTAYGSSMYFDGNGDQLLPPASVYYVLGTGDFTVELWAYSLDTGSSLRGIVDFRTAASGTNGILLRENSGGFLVATGSTTSLSTTTGRTANAWQHIALVRSSGTLSLYLGGSLQTSTAYSTNLTDNALRISGFVDTNASPYAYYGYMQDLRISKYARYTSAFQPPSAPLALR